MKMTVTMTITIITTTIRNSPKSLLFHYSMQQGNQWLSKATKEKSFGTMSLSQAWLQQTIISIPLLKLLTLKLELTLLEFRVRELRKAMG